MSDTATAPSPDDTIDVSLVYAVDTGEPIINETAGPGDSSRRVTGTYESRGVILRNGRPMRDSFSLDSHGFEFVDHPTKVPDFYDPEAVEKVYYPEAEKLLLATTGGSRAYIFDHTLRHGDETARKEKLTREPVKSVHNDYTAWSAEKRLRDFLPDEADELLRRRFAIVQIWRAINRPIEIDPLAMCDARTLDKADLVVAERRSPGRIGQTYRIAYNPAHEWYWFPRMTRDEALVFKVYDSAGDGAGGFTAHTSFDNPLAPADAPPRESMELRSFVFW